MPRNEIFLNPQINRDWTSAKKISQRHTEEGMIIIVYILTRKPKTVFIYNSVGFQSYLIQS